MAAAVLEEVTIRDFPNLTTVLEVLKGSERKIFFYSIGAAAAYLGWRTLKVLKKSYAARFFNDFAVNCKDAYKEPKKKLFESLKVLKKFDAESKKQKKISILEIGVGAGANFDFYPDGSHLFVVDQNPYLEKYYNAVRGRHPNIESGELIVARGENMKIIPSSSIDAVVVTLALCSVDDVQMVIDEIYRVLVPNGKFYFMEHVKEWDEENKSRARRQIWFDRLWFWWLLFEGCVLTRDPIPAIQSSGFSSLNYERFYAEVADVISPHVMGVAVK